MEKWYIVDDGDSYNVMTKEDIERYGVEGDQIVKAVNDMDKAFEIAERMNRDSEEKSDSFSPMNGYFDECNVNEAHGTKRHNAPRDKGAAMRKGNRDAERDMYGDGFKSKDRIHGVKGYDRKQGKRVDLNYNEMDEGKIKLSESDIRYMIRKTINEALNMYPRDVNYDKDGKYVYQGTGSEESKLRMKELEPKTQSSRSDARYERHGGENTRERANAERGGFEDIPESNTEERWHLFIGTLRNLASKNGYENAPGSYLESFLKELTTKEGAASFIAYLYKNGFKKKWITEPKGK